MKLPGPWSYSGLSGYVTCPSQYEAMRVSQRYPWESGEAAIWGTEVHEAIEKCLTEGTPLTGRMKQYESYVASLRGGEFYVEMKLGVREDWTACEFEAPDCWARCIVDYLRVKGTVGLSIDHKTGKMREGSNQLKMSAAIIFAHFPQLEKIICGYAWLQNNIVSREVYTRKDIPKIWATFAKDLAELAWSYETGNWPTRPSGLCGKWCGVLDCVFNGRGKRR